MLYSQEEKRRIEIKEFPKNVPDYKTSPVSKDILTEKWLTDWIRSGLKDKTLKVNELLPIKAKIAYYLGVSVGTVQSALRYMEDKGIVESKQRVGTYIKEMSKNATIPEKLTSKRDINIEQIKNMMIDKKMKKGDKLPSIRTLAQKFSISTNTARLAIENLVMKGFLSNVVKEKESFFVIEKLPAEKKDLNIDVKTLSEKIEEKIIEFIRNDFSVGDKFLTHHELAKKFSVSVKTTHDAVKSLIKRGYLVSLRGQYGTIVVKTSEKQVLQPKPETTIFASANQAALYRYEKIKNQLKQIIFQEYDLGSKLPSMQDLSKDLDVSTSTIKKALHSLAKEGYIGFSRGRYGGSFVINIPENQDANAFRWLAVSKKYVNK